MEIGEAWIRALVGLAAWLAAFAAIVLGRNLTRSLSAAYVFLAGLIVALALVGSGYGAWVLVIGAGATLALVQVFGWMLVDVDQDHLPPTESGTIVARGLAFLVLAAASAALVFFAREELALGVDAPAPAFVEIAGGAGIDAADVGRALFSGLQPQLILLGLAIGAGLLAALLLLRDEPDTRNGRGLDA
jgi:hypothetical protein